MRLLFAIGLSSLCCVAAAADTGKAGAAQRLVDMLQIEEMYRDTESLCRNAQNSVADARASFDAAPASFEGITPESTYWGEVEATFKACREDACGALDIGAVKNIYTQVFANRLSEAELETTIATMSTPGARRTQAASREAARLLMAYMLERQQADVARATARFQRSLGDLKSRYKATPR